MFPVQAKCVTFDAGWPKEGENARAALELGKVYTIRTMTVGQSSSHLTFYDIPGEWSTVFFDAYSYPYFEEACEEAGWYEPLGGNDEEAQ